MKIPIWLFLYATFGLSKGKHEPCTGLDLNQCPPYWTSPLNLTTRLWLRNELKSFTSAKGPETIEVMAHSTVFGTFFLLVSLFTLNGWGSDTNAIKTTAKTPLNRTLGSLATSNEEEEKKVFEDMVVVQKRAKDKSSKILFATHGTFDFSDGPTNVYGLHTNLGYAFSNR